MKQFLLLFIANLAFVLVTAQTISPSNNNEYCPEIEYTFTATLPKPYQSMIGEYAIVTQAPVGTGMTAITFKGKFIDINQKQTFIITFSDNTQHRFEFKKIKSLWATTTCAQVPNQAAKLVPRCEIVNIPISVPNVQWGTLYEGTSGNPLCFGSISDFEYQIPNGWSIGTTTSTGTEWIPGGNSVTVTSDASNGVGGAIYVRPRTTCGSGLQNNQFSGIIPISRPAPTLNIPETDVEICNGNKTYTLTGLPTGATTTWSISGNYGVASISNPTNTSVQVNKINLGNGHETLKATVTHCTFSYTVTKGINFGIPTAIFDIFTYLPLYADCYETDAFYIFRPELVYNYDVYPPNYQWSYRVNGTTSETIVPSNSQDGVFIFSNPGTYDILVRPVNSCGIGNIPSVKTITVQMSPACGGMGFRMSASPNPATNYINVTIDKETADVAKLSKSEKITYRLYDINSAAIIKQWIFDNTSSKQQLNVSGIKGGHYILVAQKGKYQQTTQILISR